MKSRLAAGVTIFLLAGSAAAHRLDEYLQATIISVEKSSVTAQIRLTPGVAVLPVVLATIDADRDGTISDSEQRSYAGRVLRDLSMSLDGDRLSPRLVSVAFPKLDAMKEGLGAIELEFRAEISQSGSKRRLAFENHHLPRIGVYQVNCLLPRDPNIRITAQNRDYLQTSYQLDYMQEGAVSGPLSFAWWNGGRGWIVSAFLLLFARLALLTTATWLRRRPDPR
jgi:hypothetical protein